MNIKDINNFEDLNLHPTFRAHIIYEQIMGETFSSDQGLLGVITFFYANVLACNKESNVDYDEFLDWLDGKPEMLSAFTSWYISINHLLTPNQPAEAESKNV